MYIDIVPNRNSPPAVLLRESFREGKKVKKRTIANLTSLPMAKVDAIRQALGSSTPDEASPGKPTVESSGEERPFRIVRSLPHGHVKAVLGTIRKIGLESVISAKRCRERDLVVGMIVARILFPRSKLDTVARWIECTLAEQLQVTDADENELYKALDWLLKRQPKIEQKLAKRHLTEGSTVLYDLSSSYYTGEHCALAKFGHDRDGKKGFRIIIYGVLANREGCPVAVQVYAGNTADPTTIADQVEKLRKRFQLSRAVLVGDRGSITNTTVETLQTYPALGWIGALRSNAIRQLIQKGSLDRSLFDEKNLGEITSEDYPEERLIACHNPLLADKRNKKRQALLAATEEGLRRLAREVARRTKTPLTAAKIGVKAGRIINRYKVAKHFQLSIGDGSFRWQRNEQSIQQEEQLDGVYIIRTSEPDEQFSTGDAVRTYKSLGQIEQCFRCLKTIDLHVRPIYLRDEDHVKAHIFLCVLAYYVEWYLRRAWAERLYADEELEKDRWTRDPVTPPEPSPATKQKKNTHQNTDGLLVQAFASLLTNLATLCRNTCYLREDPTQTAIVIETEPTELQARALQLLDL